MSRATSKASLLEERERGNISTQEGKILEIISLGGSLSLQEIMQIYRGKHGNIELSSVSARCNKLKAGGLILEGNPRPCSITHKTINPLTIEREKGLGEYQAWVEGGKGKKEQLARYNKAPKHMQKQISNHMKTIIALQEAR